MPVLRAFALLATMLSGCAGGSRPPILAPVERPFAPDEPPFFAVQRIPVRAGLRQAYNHTASLVALPDGELLAAWGAGSRELGPDTAIYLARRGANGIWLAPIVAADKPGYADANCVLFRDDRGAVHLFYVEMFGRTFCEGRVMTRRSIDAGHSWSAPRVLLPVVCTMIKNPPIVLRSGRWVLPTYVEAFSASQFWTSDDRGRTWQAGKLLYTRPSNLQPAVVERSDGSLLALMRRAGPESFTWQGVSTDGGRTWTLSKREDLLNPGAGLHLLRHSSGSFILAYNDHATRRSPLVVRVSRDEGRTWGPPRVISEGEGQRSYPTLAETPDGRIHLVFTEKLEAIAHAEFNLAWAGGDS
ncbi:MAG: sialidase family protein [Phycisphaerae bacterium]